LTSKLLTSNLRRSTVYDKLINDPLSRWAGR
jgi:hypothetical protein